MTTVIPNPGLGTFRLQGDALKSAVTEALDLDFRHIDTAQFYDNEADVGELLATADVARADLFLTTKIWHENLASAKFIASVRESLARLKTDYLDLLLIHWPSPEETVPMEEYISGLLEARKLGLTRHIGVSNFTIRQLRQAIDIAGPGQILTNQIEVHPYLQNETVVNFCQQQGIVVTGYMPLAVGKVLEDSTLASIAGKHGASIPQVVLAWLKHRDIVAIPSSTKRVHLEANLKAFELSLSEEDLSAIRTLDRNERIANPDFAPEWD